MRAVKTIKVTREIEIAYDETKLTPQFIEDFKKHFYPLEDVEDHLMHIASCLAIGVIQGDGDFLEGYGVLKDFGITLFTKQNTAEVEAEPMF